MHGLDLAVNPRPCKSPLSVSRKLYSLLYYKYKGSLAAHIPCDCDCDASRTGSDSCRTGSRTGPELLYLDSDYR